MEKPFPSRTDFEDASYRAVQATSNALFTSWPNSRPHFRVAHTSVTTQ